MARISNTKIMNEIKNFKNSQDIQISALESLTKSLSDSKATTDMFNDNLTSINKLMETMIAAHRQDEIERATRDRIAKIKEDSNRMSESIDKLTSKFVDLAKTVAATANRYSQISNELITVTGASGRDVRDTRSEIVQDIIKQINKETGNFLNPEKSYQKVVDIANQANIGNLEAIEEITRPMIIASETMNIKNDELASLFNKWYTRYNFSSMQMEDMVDEIRGNTAGNNATAQATMENISKFQNFIGVYADSTEEMQNMVDAISQESSRLESVGINSGYIFDYMKQIGQGDMSNSTAIMSLLSNSGTGMNWTEAQRLLRSGEAGDMKLVSEALANGAKAIGEKLKDSTMTAEAIKAYGLDVEEIYNILSASGVLMNSDEFMNSVSGTQSAIESMDDKFNTVSDKLGNMLSGFSEHFANIQERLGIGMTDIIQTLLLIHSAIQLRNVLNGEGSGGRGRLLSGGASLGKIAGTAMNIGGIAAGTGLALYSGSQAIDSAKDGHYGLTVGYGAAALGGAAGAGLIGAGMAGATIGGLAAGPIGWAALLVDATALAIIDSVKRANSSGTDDLLKAAYDTEKRQILDKVRDQEDALREIKGSLLQGADAAEVAQDLINTGILSEKDRQIALKAGQDNNITALQELTDAYIKAKEDFSEEFENKFDDLADESRLNARDYQLEFEEMLQSINDSGKFNNDQLDDLYSVFNTMKKDLESQDTLTKDQEKLYKKLTKVIDDGELTDREANSVIDLGLRNDVFQNSGFSVEAWRKINDRLAGSEDDTFNKWALENSDRVSNILTDKEITEKVTSEMGEGVPQAEGTNYIPYDGFKSILHEGETVVPKKYNPSANVTELEMLRRYYKDSTNRENEESIASMREIASVLAEIRDFLSYWKDDNNKREDTNLRTNRLSANSNYIAHYMSAY